MTVDEHPADESDTAPTPTPVRRRRPSRGAAPLTVAAVTAGIVMLLGGIWAFATPPFAVPDEPSHAVRAAATWTGDPSGRVTSVDGVRVKVYEVPRPYELAGRIASCSAFNPNQPADCGPPFRGEGSAEATSTAGFYPPWFYRAVGWATALDSGTSSLYLMRLTQVAGCAALLGAAALVLARRRSGPPAYAGLALAVTPMAAYLAGTVNSSGVEIAASTALWVGLACLLDRPELTRSRRPEAAVVVIAGAVLVFSRTFSPGFALVICGVVLLAAPGLTPRSLFRLRSAVVPLGILGVLAILAIALVATSGQFDTPAVGGVSLPDGQTPLSIGLGYQELGFRQMIAIFGWLDTGTAQLAFYAWVVGCGALAVTAVALGRWRRVLGMVLAGAGTVVLPIAANWSQVETAGFVWQGRYSLPLAVGIPLLAGLAIDEGGLAPAVARRLAVLATGLAALGHAYALYWALRRFSVGLDGDLIYFFDTEWTPPLLGAPGVVVLTLVACVAMVIAVRLVPDAGAGGSGERGPHAGTLPTSASGSTAGPPT